MVCWRRIGPVSRPCSGAALTLGAICRSGILLQRQYDLVSQAPAGLGKLGRIGGRRRPLSIEKTLEAVLLLHVGRGDGLVADGGDHAIQGFRRDRNIAAGRDAR